MIHPASVCRPYHHHLCCESDKQCRAWSDLLWNLIYTVWGWVYTSSCGPKYLSRCFCVSSEWQVYSKWEATGSVQDPGHNQTSLLECFWSVSWFGPELCMFFGPYFRHGGHDFNRKTDINKCTTFRKLLNCYGFCRWASDWTPTRFYVKVFSYPSRTSNYPTNAWRSLSF